VRGRGPGAARGLCEGGVGWSGGWVGVGGKVRLLRGGAERAVFGEGGVCGLTGVCENVVHCTPMSSITPHIIT
jgi:hypothetical protein